jgi:hypothetical protein
MSGFLMHGLLMRCLLIDNSRLADAWVSGAWLLVLADRG